MKINIKYDAGDQVFDVPAENVGQVIRSSTESASAAAGLPELPSADLDAARCDCAGRNVLVLVADGTRDQPHVAGFTALMPLLRDAHSIRVLIATGTHRADTPDDRRILSQIKGVCSQEKVPLEYVGSHDCRTSPCYDAGTTRSGNATRLHTAVQSADAILIVSSMKPHYFAGYSNPVKFLMPGLASFETIERNHAAALEASAGPCRYPLHPNPERRRNPVAQDQLEAARLVTAHTPVYALVTVGCGRAVDWATFAPLEDAVTRGIAAVDARLVRRVPRSYRFAVIGCGGYPNDETLYTAQRALELSKEALAVGAEVLWLAACRNGVAASQATTDAFFTPLKGGAEAYIRRIRKRYVMFAHKTVKFVEMMGRLRAVHLVSELAPDLLPVGCMIRCDAPQAIVADWVRTGEPILFIDDGNTLAVTRGAG